MGDVGERWGREKKYGKRLFSLLALGLNDLF